MMTNPLLKIVDWRIETWHSSNTNTHAIKIRDLVQNGWEPYSELTCNNASYRMIMVKYEMRDNASDFMQQLFLGIMDRLDKIESNLNKE